MTLRQMGQLISNCGRTVARAALAWLLCQSVCAQELEPRRWTHLPVGINFAGVGYIYRDSDIKLDPALEVEDASFKANALAISYIRTLDVFGKTGRVDVLAPYTSARWDGVLQGQPRSVRRRGFADPRVRFALNLLGSPAQRSSEFQPDMGSTILGLALDVTMPLGEYQEDKLLNIGSNRWVVRPQIGVVRKWAQWSAELTGSVFFYGDNDEFAAVARQNPEELVTRKNDPLYAVQGHLIYTFRPGLWTSASVAYGTGAQSEVNGRELNDRVKKIAYALSVGVPISRTQGVKIAWLAGDTQNDVGDDDDRLVLAYSMMWGGD